MLLLQDRKDSVKRDRSRITEIGAIISRNKHEIEELLREMEP